LDGINIKVQKQHKCFKWYIVLPMKVSSLEVDDREMLNIP
jgi:hypothetical protein